MQFKDRLASALRTRGLTHKEAAARIGCSTSNIGFWLRGAEPRRPQYEAILAAFPEVREAVERERASA